jgi:hypothetical protein
MHVQTSLVFAALLFLFWGVALLFGQDAKFGMFSSGTYDSVSVSMLGAAFLGYVFVFVIVASNPAPDTVGSIAAALILLSVIAGYQMLVSHTMPMGMPNVISLAANTAIGVFLMIGRTQMGSAEGGTASGAGAAAKTTSPAAKKAPSTAKKTSKKKTAASKATTKKKAVKKARR